MISIRERADGTVAYLIGQAMNLDHSGKPTTQFMTD